MIERDRRFPLWVARQFWVGLAALRAPTGFQQVAQRLPVPAPAAIMVATGCDRAVSELNDVRRSIAMFAIPGANREYPSSATLPRQRRLNIEAMFVNPLLKIEVVRRSATDFLFPVSSAVTSVRIRFSV